MCGEQRSVAPGGAGCLADWVPLELESPRLPLVQDPHLDVPRLDHEDLDVGAIGPEFVFWAKDASLGLGARAGSAHNFVREVVVQSVEPVVLTHVGRNLRPLVRDPDDLGHLSWCHVRTGDFTPCAVGEGDSDFPLLHRRGREGPDHPDCDQEERSDEDPLKDLVDILLNPNPEFPCAVDDGLPIDPRRGQEAEDDDADRKSRDRRPGSTLHCRDDDEFCENCDDQYNHSSHGGYPSGPAGPVMGMVRPRVCVWYNLSIYKYDCQ